MLTPASYALTFGPTAIAAADVDGDGKRDLIAAGADRFAVLRNTGAGSFVVQRTYRVQGTIVGVAAADLDGDGDLDLALANSGVAGAMVVKNYGPGPRAGTFNDGLGCGTGDYFMNFNVAFQQTASPDPVVQLQGQFEAWRAASAGRPDAVRTVVTLSPPYLPTAEGAASTMTIRLRDWAGLAATAPITGLTVEHAPGSPTLTTIGAVVNQGGGVYTVQLTAGASSGLARYRIIADDGIRPVPLMPDPALSLYSGGCYANCDGSTAPPRLNVADFVCYQNRFAAGDPYANCDGSTAAPALNIADFVCYLNGFAAGCP